MSKQRTGVATFHPFLRESCRSKLEGELLLMSLFHFLLLLVYPAKSNVGKKKGAESAYCFLRSVHCFVLLVSAQSCSNKQVGKSKQEKAVMGDWVKVSGDGRALDN